MFKNECYGHEQKDPNPSSNIQNFTGFQPNRIAGPMFLGIKSGLLGHKYIIIGIYTEYLSF
jgi:hypothetical protein